MTVSSAPVNIGGAKLSANLRPGPARRGTLACRAFEVTLHPAIANATEASESHVNSHADAVCCRDATTAAPAAVMPMATPPQPGTAVNEDARSIVSRMKRRL